MSLKSHFSHDVFHARTEKCKMTQQQVADALWISVREYQKIEKGERLPGTRIFLRLVFFFELNFEDYREDAMKDVPIYPL